MTKTTASSAVELFLKSWCVYQDIIEHNYMFHQEISAACRSMLQDFQPDQKLRILDLGCGDASMALPLIPHARIANYLGCDLSQPALDIAHTALNAQRIPHQLVCDDMLHMMTTQAGSSADIIISSYAIHHLESTQKATILYEIARVLSPGGQFLLIDIFREPDEDRTAYMANYLSALRNGWVKLSSESMATVIAHAISFDYPENPEFYAALAQQNGLAAAQRLAKHTWHEAWTYTKAH